MLDELRAITIAVVLCVIVCTHTRAADRAEPATTVFDAALSAPEGDAVILPGSYSEAATLQELQQRLEHTERELRMLQRDRASQDITFARLRDYWEHVADPCITDVRQQTRGDSAAGKKWYDRLSIRGYAQVRHNVTLDEDESQAPAQHASDGSVGENESFFIRRARVIISGDVSDHMYIYAQQDFANSVPGSPDATFYGQIRDWYADLYLDPTKVYRFRIGQSKIPFGWENMQSSSNRIPLDRSDILNEASSNQRDLGVFFYWTPEEAQDLFKYVLENNLKGSGNYGVLGLGVYNGQGGSLKEQNDNVHVVARLAYPFRLPSGQIVEWNIQGYTGKYSVLSAPIAPLGIGPATRPLGTIETGKQSGIRDERVGATFVWYPQPIGFQFEWNVGRGPGLNPEQTAVVDRSLSGGYATLIYRCVTDEWGTLFPFARFGYNKGGFKTQENTPYGHVHEYDIGVEWQFNPQMELVTQYTITDRTNVDAMDTVRSYGQFAGQLLRMQFQFNY